MTITSRDFGFQEPNWRFVEDHSYGTFDEESGVTYAFMDRYSYKAAESLWDCWDEDDDNAFSEGYFLEGMDEEQYQEMCDPWYGQDPVFHGPYFVDQGKRGFFTFQGPQVQFQGPRTARLLNSRGEWDETLSYQEDNPVYHTR